eukprot:scaffold530_cov107-Cylindrotheca_fusiformis.AAC.8
MQNQHATHDRTVERAVVSPDHQTVQVQQHCYRDHALDVCDRISIRTNAQLRRGGAAGPFPLKLHALLESVEREGQQHIISWQPHGRCFVVHDPSEFVNILVQYFNGTKISSFNRQLNLYGFRRLTHGVDKGGYYHELFLRGKFFLASGISRTKIKGTKIRLPANPHDEPDFYSMPWVVGETPRRHHKRSLNSTLMMPAVISAQTQPWENANFMVGGLWDGNDDTSSVEQISEVDTPLELIPSSIWDEEEAILTICEPTPLAEPYVCPSRPGEVKECVDGGRALWNLLGRALL